MILSRRRQSLFDDPATRSIALLDEAERAAANRPARRTSRRRQAWNRSLKVVRRIHLYTGLALVPWVFLYGITGYLFNHPGALGAETTPVEAAILADAGMPILPDPQDTADRIVAELNENAGAPRYRIDDQVPAAFRGRIAARVGGGRGRDGGQDSAANLQLTLAADGKTASLRSLAPRRGNRRQTLGPRDGLTVGAELPKQVEAAAQRIFTAIGDQRRPRVESLPRLDFGLIDTEKDQHLRSSYRLDRRSLTATPVRQPSAEPDYRSFFLRLHKLHTYPEGASWPRFLWAIMVDIMAVAMALWAVSGLLMWWQMKALRRVGGLALGACAVWAVWLGVELFAGLG